MKKQIVIAALALGAFVLGTNTIQAQATATVTIELKDVLSIEAGSTEPVAFSYASSADYSTAQNIAIDNSLIVTSSKNFNVNVKAEGANFVNGTHLIPVDVLQVKAVAGGTMDGDYQTITLGVDDQILVGNATLGAKQSLTIDYSISAAKASGVLLGKEAGLYTQNVTYTATAL